MNFLRSFQLAGKVINVQFSLPERYLILTLMIFGLLTTILIPVGGGFDEETHLMRVWEMSALEFIPNQKLGKEIPFPAIYWEISYRRQPFVRTVPLDFWEKYGSLSLDEFDYVYQGARTRSTYFPSLLLPHALVMRYLGRRFDIPALPVFYAVRWAGLLSYILLSWLAVRLIPVGKWTLAIIATLPTAILQASTVSADSISNGLAFLMIAISFWLSHKKMIGVKEMFFLCVMFSLLFTAKINIIPLAFLPFILTRPSQFRVKHGYSVLIGIGIMLMMVEVGGWNAVLRTHNQGSVSHANPLEQIEFVLLHPIQFVQILWNDLATNGISRFLDSLAIYGYNYWEVPGVVYGLSTFSLLASLFTQDVTQQSVVSQPLPKQNNKFSTHLLKITHLEYHTYHSGWQIIGIFMLFWANYLATIIGMYVAFTPVGHNSINGVQGRYFLTVWPLLGLGLFLVFQQIPFRLSVRISLISAVTSLTFFCIGMYLSYYVTCGSNYYTKGLCYLPRYKNWNPQPALSFHLLLGTKISQQILPECNGLKKIAIWVNTENASSSGKTKFLLTNSETRIIEELVTNADLPLAGWYEIALSVPDWNSIGRVYEIEVESLSSGPGIRIGYTNPGELLPGSMLENGMVVSKDMLIQTGCVAGWHALWSKNLIQK
ncbi:MAG: DUF2142 domain-containing protein [Anaerolineales bacterium]|nr:DUF2142 domain-containing protein [Anaerolineales bacterium]MDW8276986.1 DUF2142 domain-containing protein [Anaerolineales bacterium]